MNDGAARPAAVEELHDGDHACLPYNARPEQFDAVSRFVENGLGRNQQVVFVADGGVIEQFEGLFSRFADALGTDRIIIEHSERTYERNGKFEPSRMLYHYASIVKRAAASGFDGLRVLADMTWATDAPRHDLLAYEAELSAAVARLPAVVLCQYDRQRFDAALLEELAYIHPIVLHPPEYCADGLTVRQTYDPYGLCVYGDIDVSNRHHFARALANVLDSNQPSVTVDLRESPYVEVHSMATTVQSAAALAPPRHMTLRLRKGLHRIFLMAFPVVPSSLSLEIGD